MSRKPCNHGAILPRGLKCERGYIFIRVFPKDSAGRPYLKGCGPHTKENQKIAKILLDKIRGDIFLGNFDLKKELPSMPFEKAARLVIANDTDEKGKRRYSEAAKDSIERVMIPYLGNYALDQITPAVIANWRSHTGKRKKLDGSPISYSTVNKYQRILSGLISAIIKAVRLEKDWMPKIKLPVDPETKQIHNPCRYVTQPSEENLSRDRVPSLQEKYAAQDWCEKNNPALWESIVQATAMMLRKKDFQFVQETGTTKGTQAKTGRKFVVHCAFPKPVNYSRHDWEALQEAMGWKEKLEDGSDNPKHTVWHDLRHWAGTILADNGFTGKQIQKAFDHASPEMSDRYTHLSPEKMAAAQQIVETFMRSKRT